MLVSSDSFRAAGEAAAMGIYRSDLIACNTPDDVRGSQYKESFCFSAKDLALGLVVLGKAPLAELASWNE